MSSSAPAKQASAARELEDFARRFLEGDGRASAESAPDPSADAVEERQNRLALVAAAGRLRALFVIPAPDAPGLWLVGGEADPGLDDSAIASLAGGGASARQAFSACIGEGVEYLSQFLREGDLLQRGVPGEAGNEFGEEGLRFFSEWLGVGAEALEGIDWTPAVRLGARISTGLPADLVYRASTRRDGDSDRLCLGTGCSAGATWDAAVLAGLCEVVERDHVALWWRGGRAGRPLSIEALSESGGVVLLEALRRGKVGRHSTVLDISGDLKIPCFAALSFSAVGNRFAAGFAAHPDPSSAIHSAIIEMCIMEVGHAVVDMKIAQRGAAALNDADLRQVARSQRLSPDTSGLSESLISLGENAYNAGTASENLAEAVHRLAAAGLRAYAVDLTRAEFALPVAKVVVPGLQPYPSPFVSPRLAEIAAQRRRVEDGPKVDLF